jgi:tetratricopeptide (TPR) repeat protein
MTSRRLAAAVALVLAGAAAGAFAAKKIQISPADFQGKEKAQAAAGLLAAARELAADGTYENIAVGRVLYLSGKKDEGRAIFDRVLAGKHAAGDVIRVARVYQEAGEWKTAQPLFDQVLQEKPQDEDWLAEIGAYYLLAGDRAKGEELLSRSFAEDPSNLYNALKAASGYLGLKTMP